MGNIFKESLVNMMNAATAFSSATGGVVAPVVWLGRDGRIPSDTELKLSSRSIHIIRVEYGGVDRYAAVEVTLSPQRAYIAYGDNIPVALKERLDKLHPQRMSRWVCKNKVPFRDLDEMITALAAVIETTALTAAPVIDGAWYGALWEECNRDYIPVAKTVNGGVKPRKKAAKKAVA